MRFIKGCEESESSRSVKLVISPKIISKILDVAMTTTAHTRPLTAKGFKTVIKISLLTAGSINKAQTTWMIETKIPASINTPRVRALRTL